MSTRQFNYSHRSLKGFLLLFTLPFFLIEVGAGCAENNSGELIAKTPFSFSVYVLSRGKGVPKEAIQVLEQSRHLLKRAQKKGEVKRIVDHRIGLEGETRVCAEFSDAQTAERFYKQFHQLSLDVDLVNIKKESCPSS